MKRKLDKGEAKKVVFATGLSPFSLECLRAKKVARAFLKEIGYDAHACYQGRAVEIIYVEPHER